MQINKMKTKETIAISIFITLIVGLIFAGLVFVNAVDLTNSTNVKILPIPVNTGKFVIYTSDGSNVAWGSYTQYPYKSPDSSSNLVYGYFSGKDSNGNKFTGYFKGNSFTGSYVNIDGNNQYFSGTFRDNGKWDAKGLFGLKYSSGEYKYFPDRIIYLTNESLNKV